MSTTDQIQVVFAKELWYNLWPKREGYTSVILAPSDGLFIGVSPEEITE